jgi:tetratricopeptide (TPR) repeat protein
VRLLLSIALAGCLPALAQPDATAKLESLLDEAHQAQSRSDYRTASAAFGKALAIRPDLAELWSNFGLMQYESHEYSRAEQAFRRALGINKSLFVPNLFLGLDLLELKRPREALGFLLAAEKLNPQDTQVLLALGRVFHVVADLARSRQWYQRAADLAPNNGEAWYGLGVAYLDLAPSTDTVRAYQERGMAALARAGDLEPESPRMHALLGDAYQHQQMFREAREEYSKMLALQPDSIAGLAGLAAACLYDGCLEEARLTAQRALARDPKDSEVNLLMGEILVGQHEFASAEPYLERSLRARPDLLPRVHALRGRVFARTGRSKEAIEELTQGLASDEDGSVYYQLARLYQSSGDAKRAAAAFERSQQIRAKRDVLAQEGVASVR